MVAELFTLDPFVPEPLVPEPFVAEERPFRAEVPLETGLSALPVTSERWGSERWGWALGLSDGARRSASQLSMDLGSGTGVRLPIDRTGSRTGGCAGTGGAGGVDTAGGETWDSGAAAVCGRHVGCGCCSTIGA